MFPAEGYFRLYRVQTIINAVSSSRRWYTCAYLKKVIHICSAVCQMLIILFSNDLLQLINHIEIHLWRSIVFVCRFLAVDILTPRSFPLSRRSSGDCCLRKDALSWFR